jgi:outer membrane lipoprotein-sorting protein
MKRFISIFCSLLFVCLCLSACSLDFSEAIEGKMDELYNTIKDMAGPVLKEDSSYKDDGAVIPEENPTVPSNGEGENNEG